MRVPGELAVARLGAWLRSRPLGGGGSAGAVDVRNRVVIVVSCRPEEAFVCCGSNFGWIGRANLAPRG